ncbi:nucleoid-associated protein [Cellulosilyticum sp. I15G10I2]|uniref:nucleoid-associated protein n=1 Tax=Cellulosilyticum sp. I15G10I2 TaxID=1892843 RepID=UPI00085CA05B|nr:nucleoid-associated protein [Cellulosilyticum sp. I15G10I2]
MSITFNHTIIHVLDLSLHMPVFSTNLLVLDDETESFITKHLIKIIENTASSKVSFNESSDLRALLNEPLQDENFYTVSCSIAQKYYRYMNEYGNIPAGDLIITHFTLNNVLFIGILKLNYKEAYTHHVETNSEGVCTKIIKHKGIFPSGNKQIEEGVVINLESLEVLLLDQSKSNYLPLLLDVTEALSVKETLQVVEKVTAEIIETHYDNKIEALSELKNNISESLSQTQSLPIQEILHKTFGEDEEVYENCMEKLEEFGIAQTTLEISDTKLTNKFNSHRLKTDTGIEIKFPTPLFKNPDYIEFINNPDGTISIMLKNISQITNK